MMPKDDSVSDRADRSCFPGLVDLLVQYVNRGTTSIGSGKYWEPEILGKQVGIGAASRYWGSK